MTRRKKQSTRQLHRATPGGGTLYIPPGYAQSAYGSTFYGGKSTLPTGTTALFSPGLPLPTQPNVNVGGYPVQWKFPIAWNTFPPDRTMGNADTPSFQQLRSLAKLYSGVTICERAWMDMVPRMKLKISLKPEYIAAGANEKDYQADIAYFLTWFESPDKIRDQHSWIRMALREQTQVDELYIYKRRKRNGDLYSIEIHAGDQFKPLLDDWGRTPQPPAFAYQQYPWGVPGAQFRSDELIHYQESPAADSPYGQSRIERIILLVNQALRKQKKDLSHFTEGNIPQGMMRVPENSTWTPDQIDAFEQAWNALLAGNAPQQVRMRFTQPGMEYQPFEQYALDPAFDKFILNIAVSAYGMSMQDLAFTEDIHKSNSDSQQNVTYRRTIDPLATIYAGFFTYIMNTDFPEELHGDLFQATFTGYDEEEDIASMATAYSALTSAGILGITAAGRLLKLPDDPNAPYIGRVLVTKDGPVFLDDIASDKMRAASLQAQLKGFEMVSMQQSAQDASNAQQTPAPPKAAGMPPPLMQQRHQVAPLEQPPIPTGHAAIETTPESDAETAPEDDDEELDDLLDDEEDDAWKEGEDTDIAPELYDAPHVLQTPEDIQKEHEISGLLDEDQSHPFTELERHRPGGYGHDQKTHGDWDHPAYGAANNKNPDARQDMASKAKIQAATIKVKEAQIDVKTGVAGARAKLAAAQQTLKQVKGAAEKAQIQVNTEPLPGQHGGEHSAVPQKQTTDTTEDQQEQRPSRQPKEQKPTDEDEQQAPPPLTPEEKAEAKRQTSESKAQMKLDAQSTRLRLRAEKHKAHLHKLAGAAKAKSGRMVLHAQHHSQRTATTAAKAAAQQTRTSAKAQLRAAKQQQHAAVTLHSLVKIIGTKSALYNALAGRKLSKTWNAQDAEDAHMIALDLKQLLELVIRHGNEHDATTLLNDLRLSMSALQGRHGISAARMSTLEHLAAHIEQELALNRALDGDNVSEQDVFQQETFETHYDIEKLLAFLQEQLQMKTNSSEIQHASEEQSVIRNTSSNDPSKEYRRWRERALEDVKSGRTQRAFTTPFIPDPIHFWISTQLTECTTSDAVKQVFIDAKQLEIFRDWEKYDLKTGRALATIRIQQLQEEGVE